MDLTDKEKFHLSNMEKGYEGERKFDVLLEDLQEERYILCDLLLEINNSYFQIDTMIISQGVIHLLDNKYFQGDFYLEDDKLYSVTTKRERKNPVDQIKRSTTLFNQFLLKHKFKFLVEPLVIFNHPTFTLYQAPLSQPIIFPTQVHRLLNGWNSTPSKLNADHKKLAQTLLASHIPKNPFAQLPAYSYEGLQKGIYCDGCGSFHISKLRYDFLCNSCGRKEKIEEAILRNVREFKLLFPDRRITTQAIYEWCKVDVHKRTISRLLKNNYTMHGVNTGTYYS
ncbi:nuclease-related domain-containing protein [Aquibacillus koreensis]|nr:nuclease-related domain-containing protein [Aquibacillus koreensis]